MFSTDIIFRQQENLVDNQKCQAGFRQLCNKILLSIAREQVRKNKWITELITCIYVCMYYVHSWSKKNHISLM